jgi:DNA replicative helicase MCM subunit Mcm2 (Cdc46/Mcm family)
MNENPNYNIKTAGISRVANNIRLELEQLEPETVLKNNPFHEAFDNFLIKPDQKEMCYKFESFFSKVLDMIPDSLILPKAMVSLIIRHIRENCSHPQLTNDSATLLKNYFMSVLKQEKTRVPIINVNNNMFKTMLKVSQIFSKFRNSDRVEEQDFRMMESIF